MSQPNTFNIGVDLDLFKAAKKPKGKVINLSSPSQNSCLTVPDKGVFTVPSTASSIQIGLCMINAIKGPDQPTFYCPNVGSLSYRYGDWFLKNLSFYTCEGHTENWESVFGQDIGLSCTLMEGLKPGMEVDFRIHLVIQYWQGGVLNSYPCYIDPKLQVSHPPSTPPPAV